MIPLARPVKNSVSHEGIPSRVLVIDDEPLIRWALSVGLAGAGYDTVTAADASEALRLATMWPRPDVILLDLHQTDCSQLLRDLRSAVPASHVLVLGTCCDGEREPRWEGLEVIPKPFDLANVIDRVRAAVEGGPLQVA